MFRAHRFSRAVCGPCVALLTASAGAQAQSDEAHGRAPPHAALDAAAARKDQARQHYARGVELYDAGAHSEALVEFQAAYALMGDGRLLFNIGQLELSLQRHAQARRSLERYLREAGPIITPERRAGVSRQLAELGELTSAVDQTEKLPARADAIAEPAPDSHASAPRQKSAPEARMQHEVIAPATAPGLAPLATAAWISSGVLGLGALGTAVATVLASRRHSELQGGKTAPEDAPSARARLDRQRELVRHLSLATDLLALAALGSAGLGLYFTLSGDAGEPSRVSLELSASGVYMAGSF